MQQQSGLVARLGAAVLGAGRRLAGLAFGKAIAFSYAVIVSVVANLVFEFVRAPAHSDAPGPTLGAAIGPAESTVARARLPALAAIPTSDPEPAKTTPAAAPPREAPHPGPGSGGLY